MRRWSLSLPSPLRRALPAGPPLAGAGRLPRLPHPRRLRPPLPITLTVIGLLLLLPSLGLRRWPRPRAEGLERLMAVSSLLQSFPATPERPLPELWRQRLGPSLAQKVWRQQRRPWWQFWGVHAEAAPYLALSTADLPTRGITLPPHSVQVGDLLVVAADPLSHQLLVDRLRPRLRPSRGLQRRCLDRIETGQAVFWNPAAVGVITGLMAPFLQRFQEGCLSLELEPGGLLWWGEAASVDGVLVERTPSASGADPPRQPPLPDDLLLEVEGQSLEDLFKGLLSREVIREPLASAYGVDQKRLGLLRSAPYRLRLRPQSKGAFRASLELQVIVGPRRLQWQALLDTLATKLQERGIRPVGAAPQPGSDRDGVSSPAPSPEGPRGASGSDGKKPPRAVSGTSATWRREDGVVAGGWRWITPVRGDPQLLFFLGPVPTLPLPIEAATDPVSSGPGEVRLRARPDALETLGLLPEAMPVVVQRSAQIWIEARPVEGGGADRPVSLLTGRLQVGR